MKQLLVLIFLISYNICDAQNTKKISNRFSPEIYYVLESDKKIKHGTYRLNVGDGKDLIIGEYENNNYTGLWEAFHVHNSRVTQGYNFKTKTLTLYGPDTLTNKYFFYSTINADTGSQFITRNPIYLGSLYTFMTYVSAHHWSYRYIPTQGTSKIQFTIFKDGRLGDIKVINKIGIESATIEALKYLPSLWLPGEKDGEPIDVVIEFHVIYIRLDEPDSRQYEKELVKRKKEEEQEFKRLVEQSKQNSGM